MAKGGAYEREICKKLSLWWTGGQRDDVFWRSASSGGRATVRAKRGASTYGQYGDIQAVDPIGVPLMRAVTLELKRGYSKTSFADAIDRRDCIASQTWEQFVEQASSSAAGAKSFSWILIQRRDKREALAFMPKKLYLALRELNCFEQKPCPFVLMQVEIKDSKKKWTRHNLAVMTLDDLLQHTNATHFESIAKRV